MKPLRATLQLLGLALLSANLLLLAASLAAFLRSPGLISGVSVAVALALVLPGAKLYRNFESIDSWTSERLDENGRRLALVGATFLLTAVPARTGVTYPLSELVNLSFTASGTVFFPARLGISGILGSSAAGFLHSYAALAVHLLWIYLLVGIIGDSVAKVRSISPRSGGR